MIKLKEILLNEAPVTKISLQDASDKKLFGPVYHGTDQTKRELINKDGFKIFKGAERSGEITHGYQASNYYGGIPAPIHHLGYGIYFTTNLSIAKQYNSGTAKGLIPYYLDIPNKEEINFGAPRTMMQWWIKNGYNYKMSPENLFGNDKTNLQSINEERIRATENLTNELSSKYDAVWYKGKGMYRLLDGDQVCVYDTSKVYEVDLKLSTKGDIGSKVRAKVSIDRYNKGTPDVVIGTKGIILKKEDATETKQKFPLSQNWIGDANTLYTIKWSKGGTMFNVLDTWIELL